MVTSAGREAGGAGADLDMTLPARAEAEVGVKGSRPVDVRARQPELGRDPVDVAGLDSPASILGLA